MLNEFIHFYLNLKSKKIYYRYSIPNSNNVKDINK